MRVGTRIERCTAGEGAEVSLCRITVGGRVMGIGTEKVNLVECRLPVIAGVTIVAVVDAVYQQTLSRKTCFKFFGIVTVFKHIPLMRFLCCNLVAAVVVCVVAKRMERIGSRDGDFGNRINPVAVFPFHVGSHVLRRCCIAAHQVPRPDASDIGAYFITIEVGSAKSMEHLVAECRAAKIAGTAALKLQIEGIDAFAVEVYIAVVEAPFVGPQEVAPSRIGTLHDKTDIVNIAVIVHIKVNR